MLDGSQVRTYRADTHELVDQRPASYADTQEDLFPEPDEDEDGPIDPLDAGSEADEGAPEPVGEMATSAVGDAVFIGGDGEEQEDAPAKKPRKGGKGRARK